MNRNDILSFRTGDINVFIAVAENKSVTKAAEYLFFAPSHVSKTIKRLEHLWGVTLFEHKKGAMQLTAAGKHLYRTFNESPRFFEKALAEAVIIHNGEGFVRMACPSLGSPSDLFAPALKEYAKIHPTISVSIECCDTLLALRKKLIQDSADIIYTSDLELMPMLDTFLWQPTKSLPLAIGVNKAHPLAQKEDLSVADLANEDFVIVYPEVNSRESYIVQLCQEYGFTPRVAKFVPNIHSLIMEISINPRVVTIDSIRGISNSEELKYWDIPDVIGSMGFACRKDAPAVVLDVFRFMSEYYVQNGKM